MKKTLLFSFALLLSAAAFTARSQNAKQTFLWQGEEREYYAYLPASYDGASDTLPVLVFLHGFDGGIDRYSGNIDFQQAADRFRWLIVLPQALEAHVEMMGMNMPVGNAWNSGIEMTLMGSTFSPNSEVDDAGFLLALVDSLGGRYNLDSDSLFFAGFSMGAFMTYRMGIEHAGRISGIAAASGLIPLCFADSVPARPLSVLHLHGTDDSMIAPDGTASPVPGMGQMTLGLSVDSTVAYWRRFDQCAPTAAVYTYADLVDDGLLFTQHLYDGGLDGTRVALVSVAGGGHEWYEEGHDVQYLTLLHDFFTGSQSYSFSGINSPTARLPLLCFPNPADRSITVNSPANARLYILDVNGRIQTWRRLAEGNNVIDISEIPAGFYFLRTSTGQSAPLIVK